MKEIEKLSEHIEEEINDAHKYIQCAMFYKEDRPQLASMYRDLAQEELVHMNRLHEQVTELIKEYKSKHGEPPAEMMWVYEYLHNKHIKDVEDVRILIGNF